MAQSFQASQRLVVILNWACRYYRSRPTLLSNHFRSNSGIANPPSASSGYSITFADGPFQNIFAKPSESNAEPLEAPKRTKRKALSPRPRKETVDMITQDGTTSAPEAVLSSEIAPAKKVVAKKGLAKKAKAVKKATKEAVQVIKTTPRLRESTWHEADEQELEEIIQGEVEEQHLQRDFPDTRTIHEAGRLVRTQQSEKATKPEADKMGRSPRPLSTYKETWQVQKAALKGKFAEGWNPRKKLSPDTMEGIRALHAQYPDRYTTPVLAEEFAVSAEAIRRILKSKWSSNLEPGKAAEMRERWARRHDRIWDLKAQLGQRSYRKGETKIEDPDRFEEELKGRQLLEAYINS